MFASKHRKYKLFPLVNRRVVPGLSRLSKSLCVQSLCAFFLPHYLRRLRSSRFLGGVRGRGGLELLSRDFLRLFEVSGAFGLSRWRARSQAWSWSSSTCKPVFLPLEGSAETSEKWGKLFYLQLELFCLQLSFFAYSPLRPLLDTLSHCKQKSSNCKQRN